MQVHFKMCSEKIIFFGLLLTISVVQSTSDFRNETISCVFRQYSACYHDIAALGTNFTVKYDETVAEITSTCRAESKVQNCVNNVAPICNSLSVISITHRINGFIHNLCTNKTMDQTNFLNSSVCFNKYHHLRYNCVSKYNAGLKTDAKSLCCSNTKTLRCLEEDLRSVCPRNFTEFQGRMAETYRSYHSFVCGPYLKYCGAGAALVSSGWALLLAALASLIMLMMQ